MSSTSTSSATEAETDPNRRPSQTSSNGDVSLDETDQNYTVKDGDTINKIAAMHDTTPTKLAQINRMSGSRFVFPGQILKLPPPEPPKPPTPEPVIDKDVVDLTNNFVRINVKHITEGRGIVDGTILLTSKTVMFDPYHHHPLVAESNVDKYQVILPMNLVVNAVILTEFQKSDTEPNPALIFYKIDAKKGDSNAEGNELSAKSSKQSSEEADSEKENASENVQSPTTAEKLMYLRLRLGQPIGSKIGRDEMINTYGDQKLLPDYWFIVTLDRAETVTDFFHQISDNFRIYGILDLMAIETAGLELVREGRAAVEAEPGKTVSRATVAKLDKQHFSYGSVDFGQIAPMVGESELLHKEDRMYLSKVMPQKLECHHWISAFSTSHQGFSLHNMMRKLSDHQHSPLLLVLSDLKDNVFGAFLSGVPQIGKEGNFEGTGETFLFKLRPKTKTFNWTGENNFFYRVDKESLMIGSSKGKFGLWIDKDLNNCRSQTCATFDNEPLAGESDDYFTLKTLECWSFDMM